MNRWTGTAHLTRDPELVTTSGVTEICLMRVAVKRAARDGAAGYFDVKAFGDQAAACAEYLSAGREVGIEGRLRFEEFETKGGDYASRVYVVADAVEFLASRRRDGSQTDDGRESGEQASRLRSPARTAARRPTAGSRAPAAVAVRRCER
jgi:single-strand DNA-binding protein